MRAVLGRRAAATEVSIAVVLLISFQLFVAGCSRAADKKDAEPSAQAPATAASEPAADPAAPPARPKIVILGDSLTAGLGLVESQSFPARLQRKVDSDGYGFEVENAGVSGDTSAGGLRRLDWALQGDVRVLVVALGGNDGLRGLSAAEMKSNLSQIVARARARGVVVILAGMEAPPNYGQEYAVAFRQVYREVALHERVTLLPFLLDKVAGHPELNQPDGIHPNARGAEIVADNVWSVLKPLLDQLAS